MSSQCAAGVVLAVGFSLGYLLSTWFAPLPLKVDSFLAGSLLNVGATDVALAAAVLAAALAVVAVGGRLLVFHCFDAVGYRAAGLKSPTTRKVYRRPAAVRPGTADLRPSCPGEALTDQFPTAGPGGPDSPALNRA